MPPAAGQEAELAGRPAFRPGLHSGAGAALPGGPEVEVHHPGAPGQQDRGKEFAGHREVSAVLEAGFCLATPCHSWERGLNEHANGLVRQYFPKGAGLTRVTAEGVRQVEDRLNRFPRKALGCRTPFEVFHVVLLST
ncbi:MAG: IS30 family transposase [Gammaproteobacteria bacterium]|nr:IS30 family transposase [Gammaproteobacteria bacterium]